MPTTCEEKYALIHRRYQNLPASECKWKKVSDGCCATEVCQASAKERRPRRPYSDTAGMGATSQTGTPDGHPPRSCLRRQWSACCCQTGKLCVQGNNASGVHVGTYRQVMRTRKNAGKIKQSRSLTGALLIENDDLTAGLLVPPY